MNTYLESLKDSGGRGVAILPISRIRQNDYDYWSKLINECFNLEVGEAFYSYIMSIDTSNLHTQRDFPETEGNDLARSILFTSPKKFLKNLIITKSDYGFIKPKDLYKIYERYCDKCKLPTELFQKFNKIIHELAINAVKRDNQCTNYYNLSLPVLQAIADKEKWIGKYDMIDEEESDDDEFNCDPNIKQIKLLNEENQMSYEQIKILKPTQAPPVTSKEKVVESRETQFSLTTPSLSLDPSLPLDPPVTSKEYKLKQKVVLRQAEPDPVELPLETTPNVVEKPAVKKIIKRKGKVVTPEQVTTTATLDPTCCACPEYDVFAAL
jgi:hypothetical protein